MRAKNPEGLFDEPPRTVPPPPEALTEGERRARRVATRIAGGVHPLGKPVLLHPDASRDPDDKDSGPRCGGCRFRQRLEYHNRTYPKCWYPDPEVWPHPRDTHSGSSDVRAWWPACRQYEAKEERL